MRGGAKVMSFFLYITLSGEVDSVRSCLKFFGSSSSDLEDQMGGNQNLTCLG